MAVFDKMFKADLAVILSEAGETIRSRARGGSWKKIQAFVENENADIGLGTEVATRVHPIFVTASKADVPTVALHQHVFEYESREYHVVRVESQDVSGWRLYCVR